MPFDENVNIGERLRSAIEARGLKHSWVAEEAGITPATLSNILRGRTGNPGILIILAIARVIDTPISTIFGEPSSALLDSEKETLRSALEILQRRVLQAPASAQSGTEAEELPRYEIPPAIRRRGARAVYRAAGDSMAEEGISNGHILFVRPAHDPRSADGRLVVCRLNDLTLVERLVVSGRMVRLQSAGRTVTVRDTDSFRVIGVVVAHLGEM